MNEWMDEEDGDGDLIGDCVLESSGDRAGSQSGEVAGVGRLLLFLPSTTATPQYNTLQFLWLTN